MQKCSPESRVGRPKDAAKHTSIVEAATRLFSGQRYDTVTMEAVAAEAGVSKMTVYSHFSDKEALFEAVVSDVSDRMLRVLPPASSENLPLRERLSAIGAAFLKIIVNDHVSGMAHAGIISAAEAGNELIVDSPELAAQDLVSLWAGDLQARMAFGVVKPASDREIKERARRGTDVFLRAFGKTGKREPS
ncbi:MULTISPECIES: TetR/AcrR family transcriptional regulator [unclassified Paraburkholderia]|uniref:TetR/AcrR family transcriptional regulator n=1 Tax=unclassified Paraburkholderia TaxID=2615204 RepID=UPI001617BB2B|nr:MULTISPECIES: TetR/AcrR family transcriptional regulator [unclassified Paraburkholderia]MBB5448325.1 TetR/AcrR family transcriptional repressor of mexJK operon [Paraburkholderia sp. WSM4177]MBB5488706.1 TetR/AcrR family transcriptional repressor of mexJK operon [Paraburkholderia sp. WSM4180]